jgi:hypothetical protein
MEGIAALFAHLSFYPRLGRQPLPLNCAQRGRKQQRHHHTELFARVEIRSPGLGPELRKVTGAGVQKVILAGRGIETIKASWSNQPNIELKRRGPSGSTTDQVRVGDQPDDSQDARSDNQPDFQLVADEVIE